MGVRPGASGRGDGNPDMRHRKISNFVLIRSCAAALWGVLCLLVAAPPALDAAGYPAAAVLLRLAFSPVCHQAPDRSFALFGQPLAVCHRCCGLYLGFFLGSLGAHAWLHRSPGRRRSCILAAGAALACDALLPAIGIWNNTALSRFATGLVFAIPAAALWTRGLEEWRDAASPGRRVSGQPQFREVAYE